ncbi:hypothetical protein CesoFtcFv8_005408 [Champsocephalus esox]|uniref:Uncharacterized protein n=2 Tax=Champsocephalus TaxID=52236 RepID=A0AAN8HW30_CHAGU|nr:hypothetical protein CesoFtcFv8_005408 [Champsocephalus esox]KAK5931144.1 hypothetical protein CgunFtcFv8_027316 [Champsocephalus gunnari]
MPLSLRHSRAHFFPGAGRLDEVIQLKKPPLPTITIHIIPSSSSACSSDHQAPASDLKEGHGDQEQVPI